MADMKRQRDATWYPPNTWDYVPLQVLMDIREELKSLNSLFRCHNVTKGFLALAKLARNEDKAFQRRVEQAARKRVARRKS